nr:hypothetical protein [Nannocystis sp.]
MPVDPEVLGEEVHALRDQRLFASRHAIDRRRQITVAKQGHRAPPRGWSRCGASKWCVRPDLGPRIVREDLPQVARAISGANLHATIEAPEQLPGSHAIDAVRPSRTERIHRHLA